MNMGVEPYLVTSSLLVVCAQRLVRRICEECKEEIEVPTQVQKDLGFPAKELDDTTFYQGKGCAVCNETGYKGRIGLFEVMEVTEAVRELILMGASAMELKKQAIEDGMLSLRDSGLEKIRQGVTTIEEVLRETVKN
jgi:type IV pilus assembly protein PilB